MNTRLIKELKDPNIDGYDTPAKANAYLLGLCQDAADALAKSAVPERKPWVGLTEDERRHLRKCNQKHDAFAKAIEAAIKEKNYG